jgi:hypothetical protein
MTNPVPIVIDRVKAWLDEPTPRKAMLPAYLILTVGMITGFARFEAIAEQRAADLADNNAAILAANDLQQCLTRVDTRDSIREVMLGIVDLFDPSQGVNDIRYLIETDYPRLDPAVECEPIDLEE